MPVKDLKFCHIRNRLPVYSLSGTRDSLGNSLAWSRDYPVHSSSGSQEVMNSPGSRGDKYNEESNEIGVQEYCAKESRLPCNEYTVES